MTPKVVFQVELVIPCKISGTTDSIEFVSTRFMAHINRSLARSGVSGFGMPRTGSRKNLYLSQELDPADIAPMQYVPKVNVRKVGITGQPFVAALFLACACLLAATTVKAFLASSTLPPPRVAALSAVSSRVRPTGALRALNMMVGEPELLPLLDPTTAVLIGGAAMSVLHKHAVRDLEKLGIGPPRGGYSRIVYDGNSIKPKKVSAALPIAAYKIGKKKSKMAMALRTLSNIGSERSAEMKHVARAKFINTAHSIIHRVNEGQEETAPITSQLAKDFTFEMLENALDKTDMAFQQVVSSPHLHEISHHVIMGVSHFANVIASTISSGQSGLA